MTVLVCLIGIVMFTIGIKLKLVWHAVCGYLLPISTVPTFFIVDPGAVVGLSTMALVMLMTLIGHHVINED